MIYKISNIIHTHMQSQAKETCRTGTTPTMSPLYCLRLSDLEYEPTLMGSQPDQGNHWSALYQWYLFTDMNHILGVARKFSLV